MEERLQDQKIIACPICGSPVTLHGHASKYYIPINPDYLMKIEDETFIHDRLHRAEKIITELRKQIMELEKIVDRNSNTERLPEGEGTPL